MNALMSIASGNYPLNDQETAYGLRSYGMEAANYCWPTHQTFTYQCCSCGTPSAMRAAGIEMLLAATMASLKLPKGSEEGKRLLAAIDKLRGALSA